MCWKFCFVLGVAGRIWCHGASCWLIIWSLRKCELHWAWTAARSASQALPPSPKTPWSTSWVWTSQFWRCTAWVKALAPTPSPLMKHSALQGQWWSIIVRFYTFLFTIHATWLSEDHKFKSTKIWLNLLITTTTTISVIYERDKQNNHFGLEKIWKITIPNDIIFWGVKTFFLLPTYKCN